MMDYNELDFVEASAKPKLIPVERTHTRAFEGFGKYEELVYIFPRKFEPYPHDFVRYAKCGFRFTDWWDKCFLEAKKGLKTAPLFTIWDLLHLQAAKMLGMDIKLPFSHKRGDKKFSYWGFIEPVVLSVTTKIPPKPSEAYRLYRLPVGGFLYVHITKE